MVQFQGRLPYRLFLFVELGRRIVCLECEKEFISKRDGKFCSKECCALFNAKENKPRKEQLQLDTQTMNWSQIGKKYHISHTTAIKWAKAYDLYNSCHSKVG